MRRKQPSLKLLIILGLGVVLVLAQQQNWLRPVAGLFHTVSTPARQLLVGAGRGLGGWGSSGRLEEENNQLKAELSEARRQLTLFKEAAAQNKSLRQQLGFEDQTQYSLEPAEVLAYQPDNYRQFLTINRGSRHGLRNGQAVVAEGFLVGKLSDVGARSSKVFLINNPDFKVNGIDQESRASGTVKGQLGSGLIMDKIPQGESVKPGDSIITSGLAGEFPKGLLIGQVESIDQSENAIFQTAQVASSVKFNKLELVFVVEE